MQTIDNSMTDKSNLEGSVPVATVSTVSTVAGVDVDVPGLFKGWCEPKVT
jgi:hypothetical protein